MYYKNSILAIFAVLFLSSCASTDGARTEQQGAGLGALLGAGIGYALGGEQGAIFGGLVGGTSGAIYGNKLSAKKKEYSSAEAFYKDSINKLRAKNNALDQDNKRIASYIDKVEKQLITVNASSTPPIVQKRKKRELKTEIKTKIETNNASIAHYNGEIGFAKTVLNDLKKTNSSNTQQQAQLSTEINTMQKNVDKFQGANSELQSLGSRV